MLGGIPQIPPRRSTPLIAALTLFALGAMALAIPPARLVPQVTGVERGYLVSHGRFSDTLAEILVGDGYNYLAIDLTRAPLRGEAIWRAHFDRVSRIFPVWGWVDVRGGPDHARDVARSLPLQGLFLYGATPADVDAVRRERSGLRVVPVVRAGAWPGGGEFAVALPPERFPTEAAGVRLPVLLADRLDGAAVAAARATASGDYLVCSVAVLD